MQQGTSRGSSRVRIVLSAVNVRGPIHSEGPKSCLADSAGSFAGVFMSWDDSLSAGVVTSVGRTKFILLLCGN
jgi:hypothetical protein